MPKGPGPRTTVTKRPTSKTNTNETAGYLGGLYFELHTQIANYVTLVNQMMALQARVEVAEKNLRNTREHFADQIRKSKDAVPNDWSTNLACARFVGARLSEACMELLKQHRKLTPAEFLNALNLGQYRFRTHTPFREIHGALLRQQWAERVGDEWLWKGTPDETQMEMQLRVVDSPANNVVEEKKAS